MLGDLNDKLSQVQRLDILEATDNQAMKYFQSQPTNDVTDQALALRAKALEKIGRFAPRKGSFPPRLSRIALPRRDRRAGQACAGGLSAPSGLCQ